MERLRGSALMWSYDQSTHPQGPQLDEGIVLHEGTLQEAQEYDKSLSVCQLCLTSVWRLGWGLCGQPCGERTFHNGPD